MGERWMDLSRIPPSKDGFYATNNQFQRTGPKGFIEVKALENQDVYVRVDLPGVPNRELKLSLNVKKKAVTFSGKTLSDDDDEKDCVREYFGVVDLSCDCCKFTEGKAITNNGVLRMTVSRDKVKERETKCTPLLLTGKSGRKVENHPFVAKGRKAAFVGEPTAEGGFKFAVDVPGAGGDDVLVSVQRNEVVFYAETKDATEHDGSGRIYKGGIVCPFSAPSLSASTVSWDVEFGVLKVLIVPPKTPATTS